MSGLFLKDYKNDQLKSHGWPADSEYLAYKVSKALTNGYTRILAKALPKLRINSVHPGYCKTDITLANTPRKTVPVASLRWRYCRREARLACSSSAQKKHPLCNS